jgi:uncharacterized protein DUF6941
MRIEWATLCRFAEQTSGGTNIIGAGIDTVHTIDDPPFHIDLWIAMCLAARYDELGKATGSLAIGVANPDMQAVFVRNLKVKLEDPAPAHIEGEDGRIIMALHMTFEAPANGQHTVGISVDRQTPLTLPLRLTPRGASGPVRGFN